MFFEIFRILCVKWVVILICKGFSQVVKLFWVRKLVSERRAKWVERKWGWGEINKLIKRVHFF